MLQQQKTHRKTSETQKGKLIEYFEEHPDAQGIVSATNTDSDVKRRIWSEVANLLNFMPGGVQKTELKWAKTWADMKVYAKNRAKSAKLRKQPLHTRKPTELDKRILRVIGQEQLLNEWETAIENDDKQFLEESTTISIKQSSQAPEQSYEYEYIEDEIDENSVVEVYEEALPETEDNYSYIVPGESPESDETSNFTRADSRKRKTELIDLDLQDTKRFHKDEEPLTPETNNINNENPEPFIDAINNLAAALNNVASALVTIADVVKYIPR